MLSILRMNVLTYEISESKISFLDLLLYKDSAYVDPQLSYDEHISKTVSSCVSRLCQINRVKHVFDKITLKLVINALVLSRLFYCSSVWSNTAKKNVDKLQLVQNFAARIVTNKRKYEHTTPILRSLNWLPVRDQLYFRYAVLAFKCMSGLAPVYLSDKLITRSTASKRELDTRNLQMLNIPLFRTATEQKTFYYRTVNIWNNLILSYVLMSIVLGMGRWTGLGVPYLLD